MLNVINKTFMLRVFMLNVIMVNVVKLNAMSLLYATLSIGDPQHKRYSA
jgi:hypothetical protein